jgi:hypothetical protein
MSAEQELIAQVRGWASRRLPGEPKVAGAAVAAAMYAYAGGASVAEACEQARVLIESWSRHPSRPTHRTESELPAAS